MSERQRLCLGCRKYFRSSGASNRFCKVCKKKNKKLNGSFPSLDMSAVPPGLASTIYNRYYDKPKVTKTTFKSQQKPFIPKPKPLPLNTDLSEWGPPYPRGI